MNHTKTYANVAYKISYNIYKILKQVKQHHPQFGLPLTFEKLPASITKYILMNYWILSLKPSLKHLAHLTTLNLSRLFLESTLAMILRQKHFRYWKWRKQKSFYCTKRTNVPNRFKMSSVNTYSMFVFL